MKKIGIIMIKTIKHLNKEYPEFQINGGASRFCRPFALEVCEGEGYDIGFGKEEWKFPGAVGIDSCLCNGFDAHHLPDKMVDYIHSSHCLEHLPDWVDALDHWGSRLKVGGVLFLYLPDYSQTYHRPWSNRKHKNIFTPLIIKDYLESAGYKNIFVSGVDLYNAFISCAEKS